MLADGNPNMAGFFCRKADIDDLVTTPGLSRRLRLDHEASPFSDAGAHAVLEGPASPSIVARSGIPVRQGSMGTPPPAGYVGVPTDLANPPFTSNGLPASLDGRVMAEMRMSQPTAMTPDVTILRFRNHDGSPLTVSLGQAGASDRWVLRMQLDLNGVPRYSWEPLLP